MYADVSSKQTLVEKWQWRCRTQTASRIHLIYLFPRLQKICGTLMRWKSVILPANQQFILEPKQLDPSCHTFQPLSIFDHLTIPLKKLHKSFPKRFQCFWISCRPSPCYMKPTALVVICFFIFAKTSNKNKDGSHFDGDSIQGRNHQQAEHHGLIHPQISMHT